MRKREELKGFQRVWFKEPHGMTVSYGDRSLGKGRVGRETDFSLWILLPTDLSQSIEVRMHQQVWISRARELIKLSSR